MTTGEVSRGDQDTTVTSVAVSDSLAIPATRVGVSSGRRLPVPEPGRWAAEDFVATHLGHLLERRRSVEESPSSPAFRGGQRAADEALAALVAGSLHAYADHRDDAYPQPRRRVSRLSPWIRHGLLSLPTVWDSLDSLGGDPADIAAYRQALLWQEYARHWYARLGRLSADIGGRAHNADTVDGEPSLSRHPSRPRRANDSEAASRPTPPAWDRRLGCIELVLDELEEDGWLVGSTRQWLASQWTVRNHQKWRQGDDYFFTHLLDGSRAANRLGWLQVSGAGADPSSGFSRWQVEEHAPGLCASCEMATRCPIEQWPPEVAARGFGQHYLLEADPDLVHTTGPSQPVVNDQPDAVWLTAESLGDHDPALTAHPDVPAVFVFDEPLLARLRLSSKRLVFITETLSELAASREVKILLGKPVDLLAGSRLAGTFTPVPGWRTRSARLELAALHPWPWLRRPHGSRIDSFLGWQAGLQ
ncbi:MAG: deoxyribodipyrimidine photolyase [Actinomycetia bacterium]|nr:deoxyribodipyrimidine photolyase [Actinomycetes bacterium]